MLRVIRFEGETWKSVDLEEIHLFFQVEVANIFEHLLLVNQIGVVVDLVIGVCAWKVSPEAPWSSAIWKGSHNPILRGE